MLTSHQQKVACLIEKGFSLFITGKAGSGKSFFLREVFQQLKTAGKNVVVTAPTGIAAANIGGCTIHSFAGFGTGKKSVHEIIHQIKSDEEAVLRWESCEVLVVDEISMLSRELFEKLEMIARCLKKSTKPFGGIQLILSGDFYQLKPVSNIEEDLYCFTSPMWKACLDVGVYFEQIYRQRESDLLELLDDLRLGQLSPRSRHFIAHFLSKPLKCDPLELVRLFSHKDAAAEANNECLKLLSGNEILWKFL